MEGLERSLAKEGWGWTDGLGAHKWRVGDSRLAAITGTRLGNVGFSTSSKQDMWMRGVKFRSELVGPDGLTVLPWGEIPGWVGWLPPKCSTTGRGDGIKHKVGGGSGWKDQVMTQQGQT